MRFRDIILTVLTGLLCVGSLVAADNYIYSDAYRITNTVSVTVQDGTKPYYLTSVLLTLDAAVSNTFTVAYSRAGVTNLLLSANSANMSGVSWYLPARVYFKRGDILLFGNSVAAPGYLTLNAEF